MLFSSNNSVNFRQKLVVLVGFQICLILIANTFCANEMADELIYENQMDEMVDHYEGIERVKARLAELDLQRCCSGRVAEEEICKVEHCHCMGMPNAECQEIWCDNPEIITDEIWFMDQMDISRINIDRKYKEGKYLLFVDKIGRVFRFDLSLESEAHKPQKIKEFIRD